MSYGKMEQGETDWTQKSLIPICTPSDHEFFPGGYVLNNPSAEDHDYSEKHMGVVKSMNSKEKTVHVRRFKSPSKLEDSTEHESDEIVSAYELSKHPDHNYLIGDVVIRLSREKDFDGTTAHKSSVQHNPNLEAEQIRKHSNDYETEQATKEVVGDITRLSWIGNITGSQDGDLEVTWADGLVSKSCGKRIWMKKVQKEWSILEKNLPDGIYVTVFEERMDLLRAVIVGACGTPYQDGLFFFDFHLPPEYPQIPPSAHYHSGGLRINPNLYDNGKVCLSLLNTWSGRENEVWDPLSSSILQVLV